MAFHLTKRVIKLLCGPEHTERGEAYVREGAVRWRKADDARDRYVGEVAGKRRCDVVIDIDGNGDVSAECSCLAFYADSHYCKHVAAVLLAVHRDEHGGGDGPARTAPLDGIEVAGSSAALPGQDASGRKNGRFHADGAKHRSRGWFDSREDAEVAQAMLRLLTEGGGEPGRIGAGSALLDNREPARLEVTCRLVPSGHVHLIGIELKLGTKRLYQVHRIKELLEHVSRRVPYPFTKHFTYEHDRHRLAPEDRAVLGKLYDICRQDRFYQDTLYRSGTFYSRSAKEERMLLIPPFAWEGLLAALLEAPIVKVVTTRRQGRLEIDREFEGIAAADASADKLPLRFLFDEDGEEYALRIEGFRELAVLDAYGMAFAEGKLYRLSPAMGRQLAELKRLLGPDGREQLHMPQALLEAFADRALPGLMKLGQVRLSEAVSSRMVYKPLQARLYLDRVRDRLLAGLEFQYGDIVINPLEGIGKPRGGDLILMRDGEKERQILALMEHESFGQTEGGYWIEGDDAEYEFLYEVVPQLEKLLTVYATAAVKLRLAHDMAPPKVSLTWDERTDWLEFKFQLDGIAEKDIRGLVQALEEKRRYYRLPGGALMPLKNEAFEALLRVMNGVGLHHLALHGDTVKLPAVRALALMDEPASPGVKLSGSIRTLLDRLRHPDQQAYPVPAELEPVLREYQAFGYQWMRTLAQYRFGGILADEMGLGKTVQSIAFLASMLESIRERRLPALIVSPASLMYNWLHELSRFAPHIRAVVADGNHTERGLTLGSWGLPGAAQQNDAATPAEDAAGMPDDMPDVIITSYPLLRRDYKAFAGRAFHTLILDEAQAFKNSATQTFQAVRSLQAEYRFALTGTPVENRLDELRSIFEVVFPGLLPDRREFAELPKETVARRVRPFLLRRRKSDVLRELPDKIETVQRSELLPEQKKLYAAYLAKLRQDTLKHLDSGDEIGRLRIRILAGITRLRQICCHPVLFVDGYNGGSAKFEQLLELIEEGLDSGKRLLVFSQFTEMLGLIRRELGYRGISHFYLDGATPAAERVELCRRFNEGERELFLLSLKAGGTGLNLTGADTVVLYDLWWNPAVEQQAADRAHRIGQKNTVQVIRLAAQGTVEEKMLELQERKRNLIDEVAGQGGESMSSLTEQDIRELLSL
mgnify:CR=1 FL=1